MNIHFNIVPKESYDTIIPLVYQLNNGRIDQSLLKERFEEMKHQNHECAGMYDGNKLIGISGLWFCTRHYAGKSAELDHVFIIECYRNKGLGKQFMAWIKDYIKSKGCEAIELNTYVHNFPSHKFYYNEGLEARGYHFIKQF